MRFSILVTAPPQGPGAVTALRTVEALLRSEHELYRVFFYGDGVQLANRLAAHDTADNQLQRQWQALAASGEMPARVCVGAALRRGITDQAEAQRAGLDPNSANLAPGFELVGLGEWIETLPHSDRVVHFG